MSNEFILNQEAALATFANHLGIKPEELSDERLRMFLGFYHAVYLPTAATVEIRMNDLDVQDSYRKHGFEPDTPTYALHLYRVTVRSAPQISPYRLPAGFSIIQGGVRFIATEDLVIPVGKTTAEITIRSTVLGSAGTGQLGYAPFAPSVAWKEGARQEIIGVTPGRDGMTTEEIQREFALYASNPKALVHGSAHEDFIKENYPGVGRVIAAERTIMRFENGRYIYQPGRPGYLSIAVLMNNGDSAKEDERRAILELLEGRTIPYGVDADRKKRLSIVPLAVRQVKGRVVVKGIASASKDVVRKSVYDSLQLAINWETWPANQPVTDAQLHSIASRAVGVDYVVSVDIQGQTLIGDVSSDSFELHPYELPINGIMEQAIEVL